VLATIAATLAATRLWHPARREPFLLFAAGEAVGFAAWPPSGWSPACATRPDPA